MGCKTLERARRLANDEFYTPYKTVERGVGPHKDWFKGKTVLCDCDYPYKSQFFKFFMDHFVDYGLKRLICVNFDGIPVTGLQLDLFSESRKGQAGRAFICDLRDVGGYDGDICRFLEKRPPQPLERHGDFREPGGAELMREADVVVTNPPFSLFREYFTQLMDTGADFLIMGNLNAAMYRCVFPHIISRGVVVEGRGEGTSFVLPDGDQMMLGNVYWFSTLPPLKRDPLELTALYDSAVYSKYDGTECINVDQTRDIPKDWHGQMGVPVSFLEKWDPEQFEIIGAACDSVTMDGFLFAPYINGREVYKRIIIKRKRQFGFD